MLGKRCRRILGDYNVRLTPMESSCHGSTESRRSLLAVFKPSGGRLMMSPHVLSYKLLSSISRPNLIRLLSITVVGAYAGCSSVPSTPSTAMLVCAPGLNSCQDTPYTG